MKKTTVILLGIFSFILTDYSTSQWIQKSNGIGSDKVITSLISNNNIIFASSILSGVYRSTDLGENWENINTGLTSDSVTSLFTKNDIIFAGTYGAGVFSSSNNGDNWSPLNNGLTNLYINTSFSTGNYIFIGTSTFANNSGGVYYTTNLGQNWIFAGLNTYSVKAFTMSGNYLIAGIAYNGSLGGTFRTTNYGLNWTSGYNGLSGNAVNVNSFVSDGMNIYAGTGAGVYLSINYGSNWSPMNIYLPPVKVNIISINYSNIIIGNELGLYITTNYGTNWKNKSEGLPANCNILTDIVVDDYIFAGTYEYSLWRRNFSELIGIKRISEFIPDEFSLEQNYPNPFNPATKIKFTIAKKSEVNLKVYNILGEEIVVLVNERLNAGIYEVTFDGAKLSSGIYFYKIIADGFSETKRMVLVK